MTEDSSRLEMELEAERRERKRLETELKRVKSELKREAEERQLRDGQLSEWHRKAIEQQGLHKDELLKTIEREQLEAVSFHLMKEHQKRMMLEKILQEKDEEIREHKNTIDYVKKALGKAEIELVSRGEELTEERRRRLGFEENLHAHERISDTLEEQLLKDLDLKMSELIGVSIGMGLEQGVSGVSMKTASRVSKGVSQGGRGRTIIDLLKLVLSTGRVRFMDAAIVLDVNKVVVKKWVGILKEKGLVELEHVNQPDPTIKATQTLLDLKWRKR